MGALVLLVDDDLDVAEGMGQVLAAAGYQVMHAVNGEAAMALLRAGHVPALILLDLRMPVMDGFAFRAEQRRVPALAAIPVVAISAERVIMERLEELGVDEYLTKPVTTAQLVLTVRRRIAR